MFPQLVPQLYAPTNVHIHKLYVPTTQFQVPTTVCSHSYVLTAVQSYSIIFPDRKRWEDNIKEWAGPEFAESRTAVENRET